MQRSAFVLGVALMLLVALSAVILYAAWREDRRGIMTVSFLNIGQGDAIFIDAPSGRQALIDGGPDTSVLRKLPDVMPWYDRSIDVVIPTHPDADHIAGLVDVLSRYDVPYILQSSVKGNTAVWNALEKEIDDDRAKGSAILQADRGQIINLGKGAYLEVLSPDRSVPNVETNTGCVVTRLIYGATSFMLTCDAPKEIEKYLVELDGKNLKSDVLK